MVILIAFLTFLTLIINFATFKKWVNYANTFMILWGGTSVISSFGFYGFYVLTEKAYLYIFIVMAVFELGVLLTKCIRIKKINKSTIYLFPKWKIINSVMIACTVILIPFAIKGLQTMVGGGFYQLRAIGFSNQLYSTKEKLILMNIVQPIILAVSLISLIELIENKKLRLSIYLSVLDCILYILVFGGRWILLEFIFLVVIILYDRYGANLISLIKNNKLIAVVITVVLTIIIIITKNRNTSGGNGLLFNIYTYFIGSIHLFGVYVKDPTNYDLKSVPLLYGKEFFGGFLEPFYIIAKLIGLNLESGIQVINEITQQFVYVSPNSYMNNNVTMIYSFLRDFGILGLLICPFIIGVYYTVLFKKKESINNPFEKCLYYYSLSIMPFLIFEWMPARMSIVLVLLFLRLFLKQKHKDNRSQHLVQIDKM